MLICSIYSSIDCKHWNITRNICYSLEYSVTFQGYTMILVTELTPSTSFQCYMLIVWHQPPFLIFILGSTIQRNKPHVDLSLRLNLWISTGNPLYPTLIKVIKMKNWGVPHWKECSDRVHIKGIMSDCTILVLAETLNMEHLNWYNYISHFLYQ